MGAPDSPFTGRRVLVTGACGFIGAHLCARLAAEGASVFALCRDPKEDPRWDSIAGDLRDPRTSRNALRVAAPDYIFHLAALVTGSRAPDVLQAIFEHNLAATVHLLNAALEHKRCRLVLAGSIEEPEPSVVDTVPCSPYAAAKWASSGYVRMLHALFGLNATVARIGMVYGPSQKDEEKLVPYVITSLLGGRSPMLSSGRREVDWIYVDDVVSGLLSFASTSGLAGASVDLGTGLLVSIREVVVSLFNLIGATRAPEFGTLPDRPLEESPRADVARTRALTGWSPEVALADGLARTVAWYRQRIPAVRTAGGTAF